MEVKGVNGGTSMPTAKEYRQHAEECLQLARQAEEFYVRAALIELAAKFKKQAEEIMRWSRLFEQNLRIDKWSLCHG